MDAIKYQVWIRISAVAPKPRLMSRLGDHDPSQQEADAESSNTVWVFAEASRRTHTRLANLTDTAELTDQNRWLVICMITSINKMMRLGKNNGDVTSKKERMLKRKKNNLATAHIFKICHIQRRDVPDCPEKSGGGEWKTVRVMLTQSMSTAKKALVWFYCCWALQWHIFVCWGYRAVNMCSID